MFKKKETIITSILMVGIILIISITYKSIAGKIEKTIIREDNYAVYLKINPLVKIEFKEIYEECITLTEKEVCSSKRTEATNLILLNEDAKSVYKEIDIRNQKLLDTINVLYQIAKENEPLVEKMEIITNYKKLTEEDFKKEMSQKIKNENVKIEVTYTSDLNEEEIVKKDKLASYTIKFDTNGGNEIEPISVKKNDKIENLPIPEKEGYQFIEWQLNNKTFNFKTPITKNITLKAKWEKIKDTTTE